MATSIKIAVSKLKCLSETSELYSDEPYVLVTGVDLTQLIPNVEVTRYGPWSDVDAGESRTTVVIPAGVPDPDPSNIFGVFRKPCWGLAGAAAPINNPTDVILLASLMENDNGDVSAARVLVKSAAVASLASSGGMSRADRVKKMKTDIDGILQLPTGAPNFDDNIGLTQEFQLNADLINVNGSKKTKTLTFKGDGGKYEVTFEISKG